MLLQILIFKTTTTTTTTTIMIIIVKLSPYRRRFDFGIASFDQPHFLLSFGVLTWHFRQQNIHSPKENACTAAGQCKAFCKMPLPNKTVPLGGTPLFGLYGAAEQGMVFRVSVVNRVYNFTFEPLEQGVFLDLKP